MSVFHKTFHTIIKINDYYLSYLSDELINKLLVEDVNKECYIEKYFDDENIIKQLVELYKNPNELIKLCERKNRLDLLKYCNDDVLIISINEKETLLDYLLSKNIIPEKLERLRYANDEFVRLVASRNLYSYFNKASENILNVEIENGITLLEILIDRGLLNSLDFTVMNEKTVEVLYKKNKLNLINKISCDILNKNCNSFNIFYEGLLVDYLLNNNYDFNFYNSFSSKDDDIKNVINSLYNRKMYSVIGRSVDTNWLLYEVEPGRQLLDKLLEENIDIDFGVFGIESKEIVDVILKRNRFDLLIIVDSKLLLSMANEKEMYLDFLLAAVKSKVAKVNLNDIKLYMFSINDLAKFYITVAKHDMLEYVSLNENTLLKVNDGITLLEELLSLDRELTLNKILDSSMTSNIKIASILMNKGIVVDNVNVPLIQDVYTNEYLNERNMKYGSYSIQEYGDHLLNKLKDLFLNDGESDRELIDGLINCYRQALVVNYDVFIKEIENLIEIKENNKKFRYFKEKDSSYFRPNTGSVYCQNINLETLLHETGHALHHYMANMTYPDNLIEVIERIRNNPDTIKKIEQLSIDFYKIKDSVKKIVEIKYEDYFNNYYTVEKNNEIIDFLLKTKDEKKEEFKELGFDEGDLDIILTSTFTSEEYIKTQKRLFIDQMVDVIIREEYGVILAVSDILDGIYEGEFKSNVLENENNEIIRGAAGHGISYYSSKMDIIFTEMVANFSAISKSANASEGLNLLRDAVGEELYNLLSNFYYNNIIYKHDEKSKAL